jgi:dihydrofolate reductase
MARLLDDLMISLVAAVSKDLVIGKDGKLPWNIPEETALFKKLTLGHTIIMGKRTFLDTGILKNRRNIVISRSLKKRPGIEIYKSLDMAIKAAEKSKDKEIFVIGGGEIFSQAIGIADKMYLSYVKGRYMGDTFFPDFNKKDWIAEKPEIHKKFTRIIYTRKRTDK